MKNTVQELKDLKNHSWDGSASIDANKPTMITFAKLLDLTIELAKEVEQLTELSKLPVRPDVPRGGGPMVYGGSEFRQMMEDYDLSHLEAQQEKPESASQPTEQPAPSSSEAIETEPEMKPTWSSSSLWSSRVKADGTLVLSVPPGTWDLCSSLVIRGNGPEEGITPILIRKASTPPAGSASPSTAEPTPEASGVAGSREFVDSLSRHDRFMFDAGRSYEAELRGDKGTPWSEVKAQLFPDSPASSLEPAQGGRDWRDFDMRNPEKSY